MPIKGLNFSVWDACVQVWYRLIAVSKSVFHLLVEACTSICFFFVCLFVCLFVNVLDQTVISIQHSCDPKDVKF